MVCVLLQANVSKLADKSASQVIRVVEGNYYCVDCDAPSKYIS